MNKLFSLLLCIFLTGCTLDKVFYNPDFKDVFIPNAVAYEEIMLESKTGKKINAVMLNPEIKNAKGIIFFLHGNTGTVATEIKMIKPITDIGYKVFIFDYEGFGKSQGTPTHKNVGSILNVGWKNPKILISIVNI